MWTPKSQTVKKRIKPLAHLLLLTPLALLVVKAMTNALGANPIESLTHTTGEWGLRLLLITLLIGPLCKLRAFKWTMQLRRILGLYCAFYALLHFLIYYIFDQSLSLIYVLEDIRDRPYITVGFAALVILIPLSVTSPLAMRRRMGKHWNTLHRSVYLVGILAIIHLMWIQKADFGEAWVYGGLFFLILLSRLRNKNSRGNRRPAPPSTPHRVQT